MLILFIVGRYVAGGRALLMLLPHEEKPVVGSLQEVSCHIMPFNHALLLLLSSFCCRLVFLYTNLLLIPNSRCLWLLEQLRYWLLNLIGKCEDSSFFV